MRTNWYKFELSKGHRQVLPKVDRWVLVLRKSKGRCGPIPAVAGFLRNANNDECLPYFVTPGNNVGEPCAWCECLPRDYEAPPNDIEYIRR